MLDDILVYGVVLYSNNSNNSNNKENNVKENTVL